MKVLPLKGYKSLRALNSFHVLLLGLKMLPLYMGETYEDFYAGFTEMQDADKERMLREAVVFVQLEKDEVEALISFCTDNNGIAYDATNIANLSPGDIHEKIVAVCMELGRIKVDLVTEAEKKNPKVLSRSTQPVYKAPRIAA